LLKLGRDEVITNTDRQAELADIAGNYRLDRIKAFIESIQLAGLQLRQNANTRLALEVLMLDIPPREGGNVPVTAGR
jgi:hypothetical protein